MPGKRITDHQMTQYKRLRVTHGQETSAAKVGISVASARRLEGRDRLPSQRPERHWRTRADPLSEFWVSEIEPMLQTETTKQPHFMSNKQQFLNSFVKLLDFRTAIP